MEFRQVEPLDRSKAQELKALRNFIRNLNKVCVAYSGGVDSTLVAAISSEQLGPNAIAITGISSSLAPHLRQEAKQQANWIGINYEECLTNELENPNYFNNPKDRCFTCKEELHKNLKRITSLYKEVQVIDGVNHDDLYEYRPGILAGEQAGVISPLAELKISKKTVREISKALGFPWWDKPAQPCLASRIPYGEVISSKRLNQIAQAEKWIISKGFKEVRVRVQGLGARIELPSDKITYFIKNIDIKDTVKKFHSIGFTSVSLDLEGLISGKLNRELDL